MLLVPTILCGGVGSRLWPLSRENHPKPFIHMNDGQSLIKRAFNHASMLNGVERIIVVTNSELLFKIQDEVSANCTYKIDYILEPFGRNTAAAVTSAALHVKELYGDEAQMLILAADHLIEDVIAFKEVVETANQYASQQRLVTFGITPLRPDTGFGYIEADKSNCKVKRFVEKPDLATAQEYLDSGNFYWNSGMFCFTVQKFLSEMNLYSTDVLQTVSTCFANSLIEEEAFGHVVSLCPASFKHVPNISLDYALMEKSDDLWVVPSNIGWSDVGSWQSLEMMGQSNEMNNVFEAEVFSKDVKNCYVRGVDRRVVGLVGVEDLVIIDTEDALLVAKKDRAQDVRSIFELLKSKQHPSHKTHQTVFRPWGSFTVLEEGDGFKIKRIVVKPEQSLSLQMHHHRSEHWIVVSGTAIVQKDDTQMFLRMNESTYIPSGHKHRLSNPGKIDLVLIEVQSGQYLEENDIVRFDDVYGRAKSKN